jgi:hypothetical protein
MGRMALGAVQGRMFCLVLLQQLVCLVMATSTDLFYLGNRIGYLKRSVYRMAGEPLFRLSCHLIASYFTRKCASI